MARSSIHLTLVLIGAAGLTGCVSTAPPAPGQALLPTEQWVSKIGVEEAPRSILLAQHDLGLSPTQQKALLDFVDQWRADNGGSISVNFASGGSDVPPVARQSVILLQGLGVDAVQLTPVDRGAVTDPVSVQYMVAHAVLPLCGRTIGDYMSTGKNTVDPNFGCAVTANLAAQTADPRDLQRPRAVDPSDGVRAAVIVGKYQQGLDTGSANPSGFGSGTSKAVN